MSATRPPFSEGMGFRPDPDEFKREADEWAQRLADDEVRRVAKAAAIRWRETLDILGKR